jgi:beta-lactamase class A
MRFRKKLKGTAITVNFSDKPSHMRSPAFLISLMLLILCTAASAQRPDKKLTTQIHQLLNGFHGDFGVYVKDLQTNKIVAINADSVFPTASMVKVPILCGIMSRIEAGQLHYHQIFQYKDSLLYAGSDILGSFKNDENIELSKLLMLMLTTSDNTASLWLQSLAGTGTRINAIMDSLGFPNTKVNSRTPGREASRATYGWGQTSPREMATLVEKIVTQKIFAKRTSERMTRLLGRNYWDEEAISQIPPNVFIASKNGAVDASRSETMYVHGMQTTYVFSIITKNNTDTSWKSNNEAWVITRKLSRLLWNYFEPKTPFEGTDVNGPDAAKLD